MSNRSKRGTRRKDYKSLHTSGKTEEGAFEGIETNQTKSSEIMAGSEVNQYGILQLPDDEEVDEQQFLVMKEELEMLKQEEEKLTRRWAFQETKKELDRKRAKVESLKGKVNSLQNDFVNVKTKKDKSGKLTIKDLNRELRVLRDDLKASNRRAYAEGFRKNLRIQVKMDFKSDLEYATSKLKIEFSFSD
ncbi:hypothetical protein DPMN_144531 [Dreissena polymorpha]|uniref:Uncharacterized protein n=1 Tax=Dreissena polymorpha TaxID=45954 RepID=A0A9D4JKS3_DREPO|nr:hypothetical protein DPMN_144531 [Dreissena polymorpha]